MFDTLSLVRRLGYSIVSRHSSNLALTVIGIAALVVVLSVIWFGLGADRQLPQQPQGTVAAGASPQTIRVHVSGSVQRPGVVVLELDAIVADAIAAAGGAMPSADLTSINLAATLRAGERVIVADTSESVDGGRASDETGIDLNYSKAAELESLPGVGPVLAERIVAYRDENGPFLSVEDLLDVPGIGEAKLAQMRESISSP